MLNYLFLLFSVAAPSSIKMGGTTLTAGTRKMGTPNPMTLAAKMEHALVCQTIKEVICPRMTEEVGVTKKILFIIYLSFIL